MKKLVTFVLVLFIIVINLQAQSCFTPNWTGSGLDHMNFYITKATVNGLNLQPGDEIGIFDGSACVGVGVLTQVLSGGSIYLSINVSKDDPDTPAKDGYTSGNSVSFKLCANGATSVVTNVTANYLSGSGVFSVGGTAMAELTGTVVVPTAPIIGTITQPTCSVSTGSVVLSGLPSSGTWTLTRTPGGVTTTGSGSSTTISGLSSGTYTYTVTNSSGFTSASSLNIVINPQPSAPNAPTVGTITQPTCSVSTGSVDLSGLPPSGTWTLTRTPGGVTTTGSGTTKNITGLATGTYTYTVTNASGCTSGPSGNVVISVQPSTPTAPTVGTITQPTCSISTGSVILNGLPSSGTWTLTRTPGGITSTGTGSSTTISGLPAGSYTYTVTNASGCTSGSSGPVVISAQPATPTAPVVGTITQPTCAVPSGSVVLSGLPSSGTWTLTRTPGGTTTTGSGVSSTISGLASGTYTYTVTNSAGCTSLSSGNVVINVNPSAPNAPLVGTITQPTCSVATGSVELNGLPSSGTWTLTRTPGNVTTTGTGTTTTISGLAASTYTYKVTDALGCTSGSSGNVVINAQPSTPTAPAVGTITQPTCSVSTGSVVLNGLPSSGTWTLTRTPGGITSTGTGITTTISGLATGSYTYTVTNASGCTSGSSGPVVINTQPATPTPPTVGTITQPTCAVPTGSVILSDLPSAGTWTLTRTPGGTTTTGSGVSSTISGLASGTYTYTVTNSAGCTSLSSGNVVINVNPSAPNAPLVGTITQPTCSVATGSVELNGLPSSGTWTLTRTPGNVTATGTGTTTTISGLAAGTYTYKVTDALGCSSVSSGNVIINSQPLASAPLVGTITQPTCSVSTGSVVLNGLPSSGTWTLTRTPGGITSTGTGNSTTISGLATGSYTYTVTNASGCTSGSSGPVVINAQPATPTPPTIGTITQPTCAVPTGSVILSDLPSAGTWTLTRTPGGTTTSGTGISYTITGLTPGTYSFTVTNASGCTSGSSGNIIINNTPPAPTAPIVGQITQPTCSVATGSVVLSGLPPSGTWTLTRSPGAVTTTGTGTSTTISGLAAGTYKYTVSDAAGCTSGSSGNVIINVQPVATAPSVGTITQPTCSVSTGSVILNGLPSSGTWTLTRSPGSVVTTGSGTSTSISGLATGTYSFTVTNASGCSSGPSANVTINTQPSTPSAPSVGTITQPTCSLPTGSVVLSGLPASGTWTLIRTPGGINTSGSGASITVSGLPAGTFTFTVTNASGCISGSSGNVVINSNPTAPSAPLVGTITQPTCSVSTGSVVLNGLPSTGTWTLTRTPGGATMTGTGVSKTISGLPSGTYSYTVSDGSGCISPSSSNIVINAQPIVPNQPGSISGCINPCQGVTQNYSISIVNGATSYTWTLPSGWSGSSNSSTIAVTPGSTGGTISVTANNSCGSSSPRTLNVSVSVIPGQPGLISGNSTVCQGISQTFSISSVSGATSYIWTLPSGWSGSSTSTLITAIPGITGGTISVSAINNCGTGVPRTLNVILASKPIVTTSSVRGATASTATGGGNVTSDGGAEITERGVCWSTSENPTIANSKTSDGISSGIFTSTITGLTNWITYHVRAYAINCSGISYGADVAYFHNSTGLEEITTNEVSIYPNPVSDILNVEFKGDDFKTINVLNSVGVKLESVQVNSRRQQLDFSKYEYGIYFLEFARPDGSTKRMKVINH